MGYRGDPFPTVGKEKTDSMRSGSLSAACWVRRLMLQGLLTMSKEFGKLDIKHGVLLVLDQRDKFWTWLVRCRVFDIYSFGRNLQFD